MMDTIFGYIVVVRICFKSEIIITGFLYDQKVKTNAIVVVSIPQIHLLVKTSIDEPEYCLV